MRRALELARRGAGRVSPNPMVGCVIARGGRVIGEGWHETCGGPHAERNALAACTEDPAGATLYVTLEPCPMCAGAIVQARIPKVVFGCRNPKAGSAGSVLDLLHVEGLNHQVSVEEGILGEECAEMMRVFFRELRKRKREAQD